MTNRSKIAFTKVTIIIIVQAFYNQPYPPAYLSIAEETNRLGVTMPSEVKTCTLLPHTELPAAIATGIIHLRVDKIGWVDQIPAPRKGQQHPATPHTSV
ncbi:hypothetical protein [Parapedobacter tibetensis]|uniref:hypothetical protein n=1 Tax=Parapedobacter tibetensis TaxID=2972951 RepID=UPI00214D8649|nr:hypothetical protein [Parapedobacter tibetensis]